MGWRRSLGVGLCFRGYCTSPLPFFPQTVKLIMLTTTLSILATALIAATKFIVATFPGWHEDVDDRGSERDVRPFPHEKMMVGALGCETLAGVLVVVGMIW